MTWIIEPDRTFVVIMTADTRLDRRLDLWLDQHFPRDCQYMPSEEIQREQLVVARNRIMAEAIVPRLADDRWQHFMLIDDDILPDARIHPMFESPGDVVGAEYDCGPVAWLRPTDVHCSCLRFSRKVAHALAPPWFQFAYNGSGTRLLGCECTRFRDQALAAGFSVVRAGVAGHQNQRRWCGR